MERETGHLERGWLLWLDSLPAHGRPLGVAYNRYFGRLKTGKMKIRGVMARKADTPEYVRRMQKDLFEVMAKARSREELQRLSLWHKWFMRDTWGSSRTAVVRELAIHRRMSRLDYSRRYAEESAVQAYLKRWLSLSPEMAIGYVVKDAAK
jgi:DNA polymerase I